MPISGGPQIVGGDRGRPDPGLAVKKNVAPKRPVPQPGPVPQGVPDFPPGEGPLMTGTPPPVPGAGDLAAAVDDSGLIGGSSTRFEDLNADALDAALQSIEAQFGLTREQLLADQSAIGQEYQLLFAQSNRLREQELERVQQGAQERGIVRSGIAAEALADTALGFDEQLAQLEAGRASQQEAVQSQLSGLDLQQQLATQEAQRVAEQRALDNEVLQALLDAGI